MPSEPADILDIISINVICGFAQKRVSSRDPSRRDDLGEQSEFLSPNGSGQLNTVK
jgi:hypothetical protein